jgi:hypothetical protein
VIGTRRGLPTSPDRDRVTLVLLEDRGHLELATERFST